MAKVSKFQIHNEPKLFSLKKKFFIGKEQTDMAACSNLKQKSVYYI